MSNFYRTNMTAPGAFIRGPARLMWAGTTISFPGDIGQIINMTTWDAMAGWNDLGATKTGATVSINNTEDQFTIDQEAAAIATRPTNWEAIASSALSEVTPENFQFAWEGGQVKTVSVGGRTEKQVGFGSPTSYVQRRLAILHLRDDGKIRAIVVRKAQRSPVESSVQFQQTGDQQTLPIRFTALADSSVSDPKERFGIVFDQQ